MAQQIINVGAQPDNGDGDPLRTAFIKTNENFTEIYQAGPVGSNIQIANNTISTSQLNGNIILGPRGIGVVQTNTSILPRINDVYDLGTPSQRFNTLYLGSGGFDSVGNISGNYFIGNGSQLTGITADTRDVTWGNSSFTIANEGGNFTFQVTGVANVVVVDQNGLTVAGNINATNITGNIVGNLTVPGANTGVVFNDSGIANSSAAFTFDRASNTVTAAGNIVTAGNFIGQIPASTNQIYVAKNGSDSNNGGLNTPFLTIKAAMAAATAGTAVHVAPGTYTEINPITIPANVSLIGDNLRNVIVIPQTPASDLFYMTNGTYVWGLTLRNYLANAFSYNPATPSQNVFVSPYIQNITSSTTTGTVVKIDGNLVSGASTKAMIVGFLTAINQGGKGIHIINSGYSQLVNIYTIACDVGIKVESGGFCTLNGSDCSIGNYGLVADGIGVLQTSGVTSGYSTNGLFSLTNLANGTPHVNTVLKIDGDPNYYTIDTIIPTGANTADVIIQQTYTPNLAPNTNVEFYVRSAIIASAHTFEYVGAGTNPATALPQYGGIPIEANEVIQTNGGVVTFTSTDQKGNFKVGTGFTINQAQGTIEGTYFYKALFAQMTPYILALSEGT
jgi:hypothetical protein